MSDPTATPEDPTMQEDDPVTPVDDTDDTFALYDDTKTAPSDDLADRRDEEGNLLDPPTIAEHENRIHAAQMRADEDAILDAQEDYNQAREDQARRHLARARAREEESA